MQKLKILIITHDYPPLNKVGSLRTYSWAKYWTQFGHDVKVLTTDKSFFSHLDLTDYNVSQVEVLECAFLFINCFKSFFKKSQPKLTQSSSNKKSFISDKIIKFKTLIRNIRSKYIGTLFTIYDLWILPAYFCGIKLYNRWQYDIIVSSFGPPASHIIAYFLKRKFKKVFWVADYRDLWSYNHIFQTKGIFKILQWNIEKFTVRKTNLLSTVSDPLAHILIDIFKKPTLTIYNGFDPDDYINLNISQYANKKIKIIYTGNIYKGFRDPTPLFKALKSLKEEIVNLNDYLEILFYGENVYLFKSLVINYSLVDIVKFNGFYSRHIILKLQANADVLLFLETSKIEGIFSGKLFEYIGMRKPILAIGVNKNCVVGEFIEKLGVGIATGEDVELIKKVIKDALEQKYLFFNPKEELIMNFSRLNLAKKFIDEIYNHYLISLKK